VARDSSAGRGGLCPWVRPPSPSSARRARSYHGRR
jgi:hypothetical protein